MEIDHDLDICAERVPQGPHQPGDMIDRAQRRRVMGVGNEHDLEGAIAFGHDRERPFHQLIGLHRLINGAHVAEAEMGIDRDSIARPAPQQPPDRHAEVLAEDVPQRHLDPGDRRGADHPHAPEALLVHHAIGLLDVARIAADQERRQVLHGADDRARLPLERRLAPAVEPWLVRLDLDEHPVAHLGVDHGRLDSGDFHGACLVRIAASLPTEASAPC